MHMELLDNLKYTENHEWVLIDGNIATIGVTDYAQRELGDIVFVDIDSIGSILNQDDIFGSIEAVKTVSDLFMPISGTVIGVNERLEDEPELINLDPYGDGWIIKILISDKSDADTLLDADSYKELVA